MYLVQEAIMCGKNQIEEAYVSPSDSFWKALIQRAVPRTSVITHLEQLNGGRCGACIKYSGAQMKQLTQQVQQVQLVN